MATNYTRGRAFEYRTKALLESLGYYVIRSAGSKGIADLVAIGDTVAAFVQCKRSGAISAKEWNALYSKCLELHAIPLVAMMRGKHRGVAIYRLLGPRVSRAERDWSLFTFI